MTGAATVVARFRTVLNKVVTRGEGADTMARVGNAARKAGRGGSGRRKRHASKRGDSPLAALSSEEVVIHLLPRDVIGVLQPEHGALKLVFGTDSVDGMDSEHGLNGGLVLKDLPAQGIMALEERGVAGELGRRQSQKVTVESREELIRADIKLVSEPRPEGMRGGEQLALGS